MTDQAGHTDKHLAESRQSAPDASRAGAMQLRVDAATAGSRRFRSLVSDFARTGFSRLSPGGGYEVAITIERPDAAPARDADAVGKAVLDAFSGAVFGDGGRVERLTLRKVTGERSRVSVRVQPIEAVPA